MNPDDLRKGLSALRSSEKRTSHERRTWAVVGSPRHSALRQVGWNERRREPRGSRHCHSDRSPASSALCVCRPLPMRGWTRSRPCKSPCHPSRPLMDDVMPARETETVLTRPQGLGRISRFGVVFGPWKLVDVVLDGGREASAFCRTITLPKQARDYFGRNRLPMRSQNKWSGWAQYVHWLVIDTPPALRCPVSPWACADLLGSDHVRRRG